MDNPDRLAKPLLGGPLPDGGCCSMVAETQGSQNPSGRVRGDIGRSDRARGAVPLGISG